MPPERQGVCMGNAAITKYSQPNAIGHYLALTGQYKVVMGQDQVTSLVITNQSLGLGQSELRKVRAFANTTIQVCVFW